MPGEPAQHSHGVADDVLLSSRRGMWALKRSLVVLVGDPLRTEVDIAVDPASEPGDHHHAALEATGATHADR